jgi:Domain of unknown function (DUF4383)
MNETVRDGNERWVTEKRPAFIQVAVFSISLAFLVWNVAGLIANPDFSTGGDATSSQVLGVDFNGWHAVLGFALFGPGLFFALRKGWASLFALAAIVSLVGSGIWALLDTRPAEVLYFQHNGADAALHFDGAAAYGVAVVVHGLRSRTRDAVRHTVAAARGVAD